MAKKIRSVGVMTTGGDAPGMNAAIRAVVRTGISGGAEVFGIERGFCGLLEEDIRRMELTTVSGIINRGGTILHTVRYPGFLKKNNRDRARKILEKHNIDGLVIIGGNGSLKAAAIIGQEWKMPINVVPASIDNDVPGTDMTIGFDTAVNTALDALDKIRDTAAAHERIFVIEVMGRHNGFIALEVGLSSGAEAILIPECAYNIRQVCTSLLAGHRRGKMSSIVVVAEGAGSAQKIAAEIAQHTQLDVRVSILGHIQRGGSPTADSRSLACILGYHAVRQLLAGRGGKLIGMQGLKLAISDIARVAKQKKTINLRIKNIAEVLAS